MYKQIESNWSYLCVPGNEYKTISLSRQTYANVPIIEIIHVMK